MRILLVEDEPRMANVIAKGLREQSYAVDVAQDGDAGLYQAAINDYDLIVLDVLLPNLLDNAVKYTPEGGEISLALARQNGSAEIVVRDTGIGIPETDQQRVFDRFYRVDKARSRALGGAGLGLSIVRSIVEAHGGRVTIEGTPRRGSTFTVSLPL